MPSNPGAFRNKLVRYVCQSPLELILNVCSFHRLGLYTRKSHLIYMTRSWSMYKLHPYHTSTIHFNNDSHDIIVTISPLLINGPFFLGLNRNPTSIIVPPPFVGIDIILAAQFHFNLLIPFNGIYLRIRTVDEHNKDPNTILKKASWLITVFTTPTLQPVTRDWLATSVERVWKVRLWEGWV